MSEESDPVKDEEGNDIYWFIVETNDYGDMEIVTQGLDVYGDIVPMFQGITNKEFEYDGDLKILCPDCAVELMEDEDAVDIEEDF
jgi:hypothetical protein